MKALSTYLKPLAIAVSLAAFSTPLWAEGEVDAMAQKAKTTFFDILDKDIVTIDFDKDSANITDAELSDLKAIVDGVKKDAKIDRVIVASWSDKEYPATRDQSLTKADIALADKRATNVKTALTQLGVITVETHSMAEHPNWLSRTFNTKDAQIKGEGRAKNEPEQTEASIGKQLRDKGGPGKVVVMIRRVGDTTAH